MLLKNSKKARKAVPVLALVIPLAAIISVINVAISMSTSNWLDSYERIPISNTTMMDEFIVRRTISGLWNLCSFNISEKQALYGNDTVPRGQMNCSSIEYFVKDRYTSDPNDSTNAIRYAVTQAGPLFVAASILLVVAMVSGAFGIQRHRRIALFISGITFIISGLMLLIGLVVYLSALQSEIGPKLRAKNAVDEPPFSYKYGFSFILVVVGFMATELTGIMAIFYYIYWHQLDWAQKLTINGSTALESSLGSSNPPNPSSRNLSRKVKKSNCNKTQIYSIKTSAQEKHLPGCDAFLMDSKDKVSCASSDFDIPFPPPPPPQTAYLSIPRDYTTLTSCSDEEGSVLFPLPPPPVKREHQQRDMKNTCV